MEGRKTLDSFPVLAQTLMWAFSEILVGEVFEALYSNKLLQALMPVPVLVTLTHF